MSERSSVLAPERVRELVARRPTIAIGRTRWGAHAETWTPDLVLFGVLLTLTALFGRPFAKLGIPSIHLYVTELAIAGILALALWRCGLAGAIDRVRRSIPLVPLLLLWGAGAIAALRGLSEFGLAHVTHDIGLVEYSLFVPLVAVVVDTPARATALVRTLLYAGLGATLLFGFIFFFAPGSAFGIAVNPVAAVGIYIALFVVLSASALFHRLPVRRVEIVLAGAGLLLMMLAVARSVVLAIALALVTLIILVPARRRLRAASIGTAAVVSAFVAAVLIETLGLGGVTTVEEQTVSVAPPASPDFVADDASSAFVGGVTVTGDAAKGTRSREVRRGEIFELPRLAGLAPGATYTIVFSVKPLEGRVTGGRAGDTSGLGWGQVSWTAAPDERWQEIRRTLEATSASERLVLFVDYGASRVRFDGIEVIKGDVAGRGGGFRAQKPVAAPNFVADDAGSAFVGGEVVSGDAAAGTRSREVRRGEIFELRKLTGLTPGATYTIVFSVKPLEGRMTGGRLGDTSGGGWGQETWTAAPEKRWQEFRKTLEATRASERLVFFVDYGASRVRFDSIRVVKGRVGREGGDFRPQPAVAAPDFVADDGSSAFMGGEVVSGDAVEGTRAREVRRGEIFDIPQLTGLTRGQTYTVVFSARPMTAEPTGGRVGDTSGEGWGQTSWRTNRTDTWQEFRKTLEATATTERLVLLVDYGAARVRFDGIRVVEGRAEGEDGVVRPQAAVATPDFVSDDAASAFVGGTVVSGDAAAGTRAREIRRGETLELRRLGGLVRGETYTVLFSVRPLEGEITRGRVGDPEGGWGEKEWRTTASESWQEIRTTLTATGTSERLVLQIDSGATSAQFDAVEVRRGGEEPGQGAAPPPPPPPPATETGGGETTRAPEEEPAAEPATEAAPKREPEPAAPAALVVAFRDTFGGESGSGFHNNMRWRLDFWEFLARETLRSPLLGAGFGRPASFEWAGQVYDARRRDANDPNDVTGPHNSFVNLLYRTGLLGFLPFLALVGIAAWRVVRWLRVRRRRGDRARVVGLAAVFVFVTVVAAFNVALEGPYMAMFFWSILGLLLVLPKMPSIRDNRVARGDGASPTGN